MQHLTGSEPFDVCLYVNIYSADCFFFMAEYRSKRTKKKEGLRGGLMMSVLPWRGGRPPPLDPACRPQ